MPESEEKTSNLIVTSFDRNFYNLGLNLIAGLHRSNYDIVNKILVYDLGLAEEQKDFLTKLEKVEIIQYPPIVHTFFPGYLHPYNYCFKCTALKDSCGYANPGDLILWMDAGLVPLRPIDEIFHIIEREGIFFVDHSDRPGWPFHNIQFTHPVSLTHMKATEEEKHSPHMRGALIGYKFKGKYQELIDQAFEYSKIKEIIEWPKHISENEEKSRRSIFQRNSPFAKTKVLLSKRFPQFKKTTRVKATLYLGHRQDQSIYSILCARYKCKSYPGKKYCCGSEQSSSVSKMAWQSGGKSDLSEPSSKIPENFDDVLIYQHRGLYDNLHGLRFSISSDVNQKDLVSKRGRYVHDKLRPSRDTAASTITVITPSFNQAEFLPECLASVAKQKYKPIEHLIYDPGSTDGSREIAGEFSNKYAYAKLIEEPDRGQADAVSKGMLAARGDVIAWLNSDDIYADDTVFSQVIDRFNQDDKPDVVYGLAVFIDEKGNKLKDVYVNRDSSSLKAGLHHEVGIAQPSVFMRKSVPRTIGTLDMSLQYAMDYEYWIRAAQAGLRFAFLPVILSYYRYYPHSKTSGQRGKSLYETLDVVKRRYGYVHINWLKRYASYLVEKHDGILQASDMSYDNPIIVDTVRQLATVYNTSVDTINVFLGNKDVTPYKHTYNEMRRFNLQFKRHCAIVPDGDKELWKEIKKPYGIYHVRFVGGRRFAFEKQWLTEESKKVRERLPELEGERQSDTCVIVGNGPSLMRTNLNLLEDQDVFVSNNVFINEKLIVLAKYYAVTNYLVAEQGYWHINSLQHVHKFFPWFLGYCLNSDARTFFLNPVGDAEFRTDILEKISWKSTVSFFMMQIAYWLGYRKAVLIGFDHNYAQPDELKEGDLIYQDQDDVNHFDPGYFRGKRWQAADVKNMEEVYWLAKRAFEGDGREIINATVGGRLEVFKRDSLENALSHRTYEQGVTTSPTTPPPSPSVLAGCHTRDDHAHFDESRLISAVLSDRSERPLMIDVGAMHGSALAPFLEHGWRVFAFEPDPVNRTELKERFGSHPRLMIDNRAVTHKAGEEMPFYRSDESSGISSLHPFHKSHKETCRVSTTTIADFVREKDLHHIDYLKIDVEGYDFQVLKGVPWDRIKPNVIMCEFEDSKTRSLGYAMHDMARYLTERGYTVLVSEWHPVIRYGVKHDWHRLVTYPCELNHPDAWGNLIAFREQPNLQTIATIARNTVKVNGEAPKRGGRRVTSLTRRPVYRRLVGYLKTHYPAIITVGRFGMWSLSKLRRTFFGIGGIAALVTLGLYIAGALIEPLRWYLVGIASALLLLGGGLLALFYARSILNRFVNDQRTQVSDVRRQVSDINKQVSDINKQVSDINKRVSNINKQVSDIKKEVAPYNEADHLRLERAVSIEKQVEMAELQYDLRDSKKILFFNATSGPAMLGFASTAGLIISWALRLSGHRVLHLVCRKGLRRCIQGTNRYDLNQPMPCETCQAIKSKMFPQDLRWYLEPKPEVPSALIPLGSYSLDDLADFVYQGIKVGELCISSVRWTLRRHRLDSDPRSTQLLREYIRGGMSIVDTLQRLLQEQELHSMVVFNGVFYPEAIARAVALQKGLPVVAYEVSIPSLTVFLSHGAAAGGGLITIPEDFQMSATQEADFNRYMSQRIRGTVGQPGLWPEMKGIEPDLQAFAGQHKNVVSVFTNVIFDTSQYGANTVFESMFDWLDEIMKLASLHLETLFVVRAHPAEVFPHHESEELVEDWLKAQSYLAIPNVRFIPPTDYISSYELLNISRFCLVYNSTIGLEAVVLGIPTVTAAAGRYSGAGVTHAPTSREAYRELVETFLENGPPPVADTVRQRARYYMYQFFFRQGLDFSAFLESPDWTLKTINASTLHPDNSPEMNIIYKGIMEGGPFYYPH